MSIMTHTLALCDSTYATTMLEKYFNHNDNHKNNIYIYMLLIILHFLLLFSIIVFGTESLIELPTELEALHAVHYIGSNAHAII